MIRTSLALMALLLAGCTSPTWWVVEHEQFQYRGHTVNIASQGKVMKECGIPLPITGGCAYKDSKQVWSVPNYYTLAYECGHIDAYEEGSTEAQEWAKNIAFSALAIHDLAIVVTEPFSVDRTCGPGSTEPVTYAKCIEDSRHAFDRAECDLAFRVLKPGESKSYWREKPEYAFSAEEAQ